MLTITFIQTTTLGTHDNACNNYYCAVLNECILPETFIDNISIMDHNFIVALEGSGLTLQFWCKDVYFPTDVMKATCYRNGTWIPNLINDHTCITASTPNSGA